MANTNLTDAKNAKNDEFYTVAEIFRVINNFSDEYKLPFSMHISGYKYEEIAKELVLPIGTVKSRVSFARKRLQELLIDYKYQDRK
jgi:RNA polymerase sigma-70 factor (ECF subfamily)